MNKKHACVCVYVYSHICIWVSSLLFTLVYIHSCAQLSSNLAQTHKHTHVLCAYVCVCVFLINMCLCVCVANFQYHIY